MKNLNNQKLSLHKKLVVKLNNDLKNNSAGGNDKFNGNLPTNPLEGMKSNESTIIGDSLFCRI